MKVLTKISGEELAKAELEEIAESFREKKASVKIAELFSPVTRKVI